MYDITCGIVAYKTKEEKLRRAVQSFLNSSFNVKVFIVDNSPDDRLKNILNGINIEYVLNKRNCGFGSAHNQIIDKVIGKTKYHLIMNPDIYFERETIPKLFDFMELKTDVGCIIPKVLYPDGSVQYLSRLLPSPITLFMRRFCSSIIKGFSDKINYRYEMRFSGYERVMDVPYISGAFMFLKNEAIEKAGKFDQRFFMYLEDVDFSRRINQYFRNIYLPDVSIYHEHGRDSYRKSSLLRYHIVSAIKYFNKWGWFFDPERSSINAAAISKFNK